MTKINVRRSDLWSRSIRSALNQKALPVSVRIEQSDTVTAAELAKFASDADFVSKTLALFRQRYLLGLTTQAEYSFKRQFNLRANDIKKYAPKILNTRKVRLVQGVSDAMLDKAGQTGTLGGPAETDYGMSVGFRALWEVFSKPIPIERTSRRYKMGIGRRSELNALKLSDYMGTKGTNHKRQPYNSLFKAVEFGTGIAENVGGAKYVRKGGGKGADSGRTKDPSGDGSWWLGPAAGEGAHHAGQRGFHFLYDEQTRKPRQGYIDLVRREFPKFFASAVKRYLEGSD